MKCPVTKIKSTDPETQGAFVEINTSNFDPEKHELYVEPAAEPEVAEPEVAADKPTKKK